MTQLTLVICKDYNGTKNVPFCMEASDFRAGTASWEHVSDLKKIGKNYVDDSGRVYKRHADWSLTKVSVS
jgi:hypothetical protein